MYYPFVKCLLPEHSTTSETDLVHTTDDAASGTTMVVESMMANNIIGPVTFTGHPDGNTEEQIPWHRPLRCTKDTDDVESDIDDMMSDIVASSVRAVDSLMSEDESSLLSDTSHISEGVWSFPTEQNNDIRQCGDDLPGSGYLESLPNLYQTPSARHEGEAMYAASLSELLSEDEHSEELYDEGILASMEGAKEDDTESLYDF
jgi:hypothetical protein